MFSPNFYRYMFALTSSPGKFLRVLDASISARAKRLDASISARARRLTLTPTVRPTWGYDKGLPYCQTLIAS